MATLAFVLTILSGLIFILWVTRHILITSEQRNSGALTPESPALEPDRAPWISVVIAAKDEEDNIEACLRSVMAQEYPNLEIFACNDRSDDATGEIIDRLAAEDDRVRAVHVRELPKGWSGKNHAVWTGIQQARGDWLVTSDADCRFSNPKLLSVAVRHALDRNADMLSILPAFETQGFWEDVIQPVCGGVMMIWYKPARVNNPNTRTAYANGAFLMISRPCYEDIGTHQAVRGELMEDLHMARRVKAAGRKLRVVQGRGLYTVRMYCGLKATLRGWCRIFLGTFQTARRLMASLAMLTPGMLPYAIAAIGLAMAATGAEPNGWWWAAGLGGAAAAAMQLSVIYRFYGLMDARPWLFWTYPLGSLAAATSVMWALLKLCTRSKVTWRGTSYAGASSGH